MGIRGSFVVLLTAFALGAFGLPAWAQDEAACKDDCREQQQRCVDACGEHSNPIECEADCREDSYECTQQCE